MSPPVVIVGGAAIGAATAWWLARDPACPGPVWLVEADPSFRRAASALAASGIRHQFSNATNVRISQFGTRFLRAFRGPEGQGMGLVEQGYLFLADAARAPAMRRAHGLQTALGAEVALLDPPALAARFPHLDGDGVALASLGLAGEGWFDNMGLVRAFREGARGAGVRLIADRAEAVEVEAGAVRAVRLAGLGRVEARAVLLAAGTATPGLAAGAGVALPVEARKRSVFHFRTATPRPDGLPLMIDTGGVYCRPEGEGFIAGATPFDDGPADKDDFDPAWSEWDDIVWPALAARSPLFEAVRLTGAWAGHYDWNRLDQNAIVGPVPGVAGLTLATGFSGHGLQQAPAVGRGLAEVICHGGYRSLDLGPLGIERIEAGRANREAAVV